MKQIVLGSQSPRRREILSYFNLPFVSATPIFDEDSVPFQDNPEEYAIQISQGKAISLSSIYPKAIILTADTIVYRQGKIYGKPKTFEEAFNYFLELVGNWHTVYTGVTIHTENRNFSKTEATQVQFNALTPEQIKHYLTRVKWDDKAGGYAIQKAGGLIVSRIEGCYYNVMGLPINTVEALLKKTGIELWDYI